MGGAHSPFWAKLIKLSLLASWLSFAATIIFRSVTNTQSLGLQSLTGVLGILSMCFYILWEAPLRMALPVIAIFGAGIAGLGALMETPPLAMLAIAGTTCMLYSGFLFWASSTSAKLNRQYDEALDAQEQAC